MKSRLLIEATCIAAWSCTGCAATPAPVATTTLVDQSLAIPARPRAPTDEYRVGARDILSVTIFELESPGEFARLELEVTGRGTVTLPFIGVLPVDGRTVEEIRQAIATRLAKGWLREPEVVVNVKDFRHVELSVTGAVVKPGVVHFKRNTVTLLDALALANGLSKEAGTRAEVSWPPRGDQPPRQEKVDLAPLLTNGLAPDVPLERGCSIVVPEADPFYVSGFVNKPGSFPYRRPITVSQAVALAGGMDDRRASASEVYIKRARDGSTLQVDLDEVTDSDAVDPVLEPRDRVEVRRTLAWAIFTETVNAVKGFLGFGVSAGVLQ